VTTALPASAAAGPFASRIESLGVALPEQRVSTAEVLAGCRRPVRLDLQRITGIEERRRCAATDDSFSLAIDAARKCLERSRHAPGDLDMIVNCSITRYAAGHVVSYEPAVSAVVKRAIGAHRAIHLDVTNACAGMLTGALLVDAYIRAGVVRSGLVVSGEWITHLSDTAAREMRTVASRQMASLTLGDAGAAVLLERAGPDTGRIEAAELTTVARWSRLCIARASRSGPGSVMVTRARQLHEVAIEAGVPFAHEILARCGLSIDDVDFIIPHQTSTRAIRTGLRKLVGTERPRQAVATSVVRYGNTASTATFLALHDFLEEGRIRPGDRVMLMCFASGLVVGALVATLDHLVEGYGRAH
jgi:3-oxoacyl-[acyl-carrier-protein] synthase-3